MNTIILILLAMIFCHIVDDYCLQASCLSSLKQKSWWNENAPEPMYKYDYIIALFMHSFSWTFMIMLVPTVYILIIGGAWYPIVFVCNIAVHMITDNEKANKKRINLVQDQLIHIVQIILTWLIMFI